MDLHPIQVREGGGGNILSHFNFLINKKAHWAF